MKTTAWVRSVGIFGLFLLSIPNLSANEFEESRFSHANGDRVVLFSTAETHPSGTLYFSDYELLLLQVGYAFTDRFQLSLTTMPPLFSGQPIFLDLTAKWNFWRQDRFRAAIVGAPTLIAETSGHSPYTEFMGRVGAIGQYCFTMDCGSSVSSNLGIWFNPDYVAKSTPLVGSVGGVLSLSDTVSLLLEPAYAISLMGSRSSDLRGFMVSYGVRLSGEQWGVDLALVRPFTSDFDGLIMGFPFLGFTYRTQVSRGTSFLHETVARLSQVR